MLLIGQFIDTSSVILYLTNLVDVSGKSSMFWNEMHTTLSTTVEFNNRHTTRLVSKDSHLVSGEEAEYRNTSLVQEECVFRACRRVPQFGEMR